MEKKSFTADLTKIADIDNGLLLVTNRGVVTLKVIKPLSDKWLLTYTFHGETVLRTTTTGKGFNNVVDYTNYVFNKLKVKL